MRRRAGRAGVQGERLAPGVRVDGVAVVDGAAMDMMIFYTAASVRFVHFFVSKFLQHRTQAWRTR